MKSFFFFFPNFVHIFICIQDFLEKQFFKNFSFNLNGLNFEVDAMIDILYIVNRIGNGHLIFQLKIKDIKDKT